MHAADRAHYDLRATAARALAEVVFDGASLREVSARHLPPIADARDRALLTALLNEGARWWLRYDTAIDLMLERPLPRREAALRALLVLGLVQLEVMQLPAYAAVAATVAATRSLGRARHAGLANALLRRWQRERTTLLPRLDLDPEGRFATPRWLAHAITQDWPEHADQVLDANNRAAMPTLRVNRRVTQRDALLQRFADAGVDAHACSWLDDAVLLQQHADVTRLPGFAEGAFSVQDGAAQLAVDLLQASDGMRVLDACAAPGGKTAHLLERARVHVLALDVDAGRLQRTGENLARLGLHAELRQGNAADPGAWWDGKPFDRILLDAPCSATGVIRRHPDIKLHRRASDVATLVASQRRLLAALWPMLAPGGRLLYATCSVLRIENEEVVDGFIATRDDLEVLEPKLPQGRPAGPGWQLLPGPDDVDGMFYAMLDKTT